MLRGTACCGTQLLSECTVCLALHATFMSQTACSNCRLLCQQLSFKLFGLPLQRHRSQPCWS